MCEAKKKYKKNLSRQAGSKKKLDDLIGGSKIPLLKKGA